MRVLRSGFRTWVVSVALIASTAPTGRAFAANAPEGTWQGVIQGMLRLVLHVERGATGTLSGKLDSPDQAAMGMAIDTLWVKGDSLHFEMRRLRVAYDAQMSANDSTLSGLWRQGGYALPLTLKRSDHVAADRRPQDPVRPYPYDTLDVEYPDAKAGVKLAGTLTTPRGAGPYPCALLITGSGPENRNEELFNHRPFLVLADHLTRHGIAVLRVDDRGVGGSTGRVTGATSEDFASDVAAGIEFLKTRKEIDPRRIGLIGHSEGGLIAPMVATRSKDVAFIVLMAGPGVRGDSILIMQTAAIRRLLGTSEQAITRESAAMRRVHAMVIQGDTVGVVRTTRELVAIQAEAVTAEERRGLGDLDSLARTASRQFMIPWMRFFLTYDPRPTLMKVRCPVLALNGSKDFQVPPKENLAAISAALKQGGNRDATVKELPGLNHLFQTATTGAMSEYATIEETIAPAALDEMSGWIVARTTVKR
jgi:pimeloyl-ACP methyl ester carboxylesterase